MKHIEAMIACIAVTGAVLYGPVSRGVSQIETKAAPLVLNALIQHARASAAPPVIAMAEPPEPLRLAPPPAVRARPMCPGNPAARLHAELARNQARVEFDRARRDAEINRAASRYARQELRAELRLAQEQVRHALVQAHVHSASFSVPLG